MSESKSEDITRFLMRIEQGDSEAVHELLPHIYSDLKRLAAGITRGRGVQTLEPTAMVSELYLKIFGHPTSQGFENRRHFLSVAAKAMRQLLVDYVRAQRSLKRGGGSDRIQLQTLDMLPGKATSIDLVAFEEALSDLEALEPRMARVVELRFLTGLSVQETAQTLGLSERTIKLDWQMARRFLEKAMGDGGEN
ncbi:MAG: ECF-type sigma factor [Planctomycetota bacterium]